MTSAFFGLNSANAENRFDSIPEGIETVISDSELGSLEAISAVNARMEAADPAVRAEDLAGLGIMVSDSALDEGALQSWFDASFGEGRELPAAETLISDSAIDAEAAIQAVMKAIER